LLQVQKDPQIRAISLNSSILNASAPFWSIETEYNIFLWHTGIQQFLSDACFCAVFFYPYFIISETYMEHGGMDASCTIPAEIEQQVILVTLIENRNCFDLSMAWDVFSML
jgi:hypothetical protein